jgi:hypothetical protein
MYGIDKFWGVLNADNFFTSGAKLSFLRGLGGEGRVARALLHAVVVFSMLITVGAWLV